MRLACQQRGLSGRSSDSSGCQCRMSTRCTLLQLLRYTRTCHSEEARRHAEQTAPTAWANDKHWLLGGHSERGASPPMQQPVRLLRRTLAGHTGEAA
jgi:hypothetical protein